MSTPDDDFVNKCIENKTFGHLSDDLQGHPGPHGQQGHKGAKGDQVRMSKHKHFVFAASLDKNATICEHQQRIHC